MPQATIKGMIHTIFQAEVFGNYEKRVFWVEETEGKYPNTFAIEAAQGGCNDLDHYQDGDEVTVEVYLNGRRWEKNGKENVFNTLKMKSIELASPRMNHPKQSSPHARTPQRSQAPQRSASQQNGHSDLPF